MANSLWSYELQHTRLPCPSPTPRAYSNLCPLSQWCHPTISFSASPFSSHLQSFPASGSFLVSQFIRWPKQSTGVLSLDWEDSLEKEMSTHSSILAQRILWTEELQSKRVRYDLVTQLSSVAQSCPTLCDPMDCSTPGFPVHHQLLERAQTYVH